MPRPIFALSSDQIGSKKCCSLLAQATLLRFSNILICEPNQKSQVSLLFSSVSARVQKLITSYCRVSKMDFLL